MTKKKEIKKQKKISKELKGKKVKEPKEKYLLEIMVGEPPKIYKFNTNDVVETLLHSGIDPISIDFWTEVRLTNRKTKKTSRETLNVPKMRGSLTVEPMAIHLANNLITMTD